MKTQFSLFRIPKAILVFVLIGVVFVYGCYVVFQWSYVSQRMWEALDRFDHAHVFMIDVMEAYTEDELPFEKGGLAYQCVEKMIASYTDFVVEADEPFGVKQVRKAIQEIEARETANNADPENAGQNQQSEIPSYEQARDSQTEGEHHSANPAPK